MVKGDASFSIFPFRNWLC